MNTKTKLLLLSSLVLAATTSSLAQYGNPPKPPMVLKFATMVGVNAAFLGPNDVRGIIGDTLPWASGHIRGVLLANGHLSVRVRGLVFPDDPSVPSELRGVNNETSFRAMVSCLSDDGSGNLTTVNVSSVGFPATASGDANMLATVHLPNPCVAPIVFIVAGSSDQWFAMTGVRTGGY